MIWRSRLDGFPSAHRCLHRGRAAMNIIQFPSTFEEPDIPRRTVRELCRDYMRRTLSTQTLAESKAAIRLMKTYILPILGDLDQSEVDMDSLRRLHANAAYRSSGEARAVLDLVLEVFWEAGSDV